MDDDLKDLIERMSALLALVVTIGALVYALWKTVQLAGISF